MATRAEKDAEHRFRECIKRERKHLRVGSGRQDGTEVRHIGSASELHGADGVCTCCKRGSG
jgi:hypothetical protein